MKTHIGKWGNSLALRIPKGLADEAGLKEGGRVEVSLDQGRLVIKPSPKTYSLEELTAGITEENLHPETTWGEAEGKEVW